MALTNATTLADYSAGIGTQGATLTVDATNKRVGVGTDSPAGPEGSLQVGTGITFFGNTGIISATGGKFSGDFSVAGALTFEDVTNIDSLGFGTFRSGLIAQGAGSTTTTLNVTGVATVSNNISIGDSIFHIGDGGGTTFGFPAADTFTVYTDGSERVRVDSSGNTGINCTSGGGKLAILANASTYEGLELQTPSGDGSGEFHIGVHQTGTSNGRSIVVKRGGADGMDTESLRVSADGNVGINSTIPRSKLHVANGNSNFNTGNPTGLGAGAVASLESNTDVALQFLTSTTTDNFIYFGDTDSATTGSIQYDHNTNALIFNVNGGTERLRITSGGDLQVAAGGDLEMASNGRIFVGDGGNATNPMFANVSDTNTGIAFPAADTMMFTTGGTERLRITSAGLVGVGTAEGSSSSTRLVVYEASGNGQTIEVKAANTGGSGSQPGIRFTAPNNDNIGAVYGDVSTDSLQFSTGATERFRIASDGDVTISDGDLVIGTAGHGIDFSANASAGGMTSELLDDYEVGTFTPTVSGFTVSGTTTLTGRYVKVGRNVTFGLKFANTGTIAYGISCFITLPFSMQTGTEANGLVGMLLNSNSAAFNSNKSGTQCKLDGEGGSRFFVGNFTTTSNGEQLMFGGSYISGS